MATVKVPLTVKNFNSKWVKGVKRSEFVEANAHLGDKTELEAIYDQIKGVKKDS